MSEYCHTGQYLVIVEEPKTLGKCGTNLMAGLSISIDGTQSLVPPASG